MKHQESKFRKIQFEQTQDIDHNKMVQLLQNRTQPGLNIKTGNKNRKKSKSKQKVKKMVTIGQIDYDYIRQKQMKMLQVKIKKTNILGIMEREKHLEVPLITKEEVFDERKELHNNLTNVRKRYDEVRLIQIQKDKEIEQMKREIEQLNSQNEMLEFEKGNIENTIEQMKQQLDRMKYNIDRENLDNKSLEYMLLRYRKDMIQYQLRSQKLEDRKQKVDKKLSHLVEVNQSHIQMYEQSTYVLNSLLRNVEEDDWIRQNKFNILTETVNVKVEAETKRTNQIQKRNEVAETAAYELKYDNEKKWRNLLIVNRFLLSFLKSKMGRMIKYYDEVEGGYQKIKTSTGVDDIEEIMTKFINRESIYDNLLQQINQYETQIEKQKCDNMSMNNELIDYEVQRQNIQQQEISQGKKLIKDYLHKYEQINKELAMIYDKEKKIKIVEQQVIGFTNRINHKIGKLDGDVYQYDIDGDFQTQFMAISGLLFQQFKQIKKIKEINKDQSISFSKTFILQNNNESYIKRNVRVDKVKSRMNEYQSNDKMSTKHLQSDDESGDQSEEDQYEKKEMQYMKQLRKESKKQFEIGIKKKRHKQ